MQQYNTNDKIKSNQKKTLLGALDPANVIFHVKTEGGLGMAAGKAERKILLSKLMAKFGNLVKCTVVRHLAGETRAAKFGFTRLMAELSILMMNDIDEEFSEWEKRAVR